MSENQDEPQYAPWYRLPSRHIVAVEHPGIVENVDRAIKTLQGDAGISKASYQLLSERMVAKILHRYWTHLDQAAKLNYAYAQRIQWQIL